VTNGLGPWQYQPREALHSITGGTTAYNTGVGPVMESKGPAIDGYLNYTVVQGAASATATLYVYVDD